MDVLSPIILSFDQAEQTVFREWLKRTRNAQLESQLFELIVQEPPLTSVAIEMELYGDQTHHAAYKGSRRRLLNSVTEFVVMKHMESDATGMSATFGNFTMGAFLVGKGRPNVAEVLLKRAESIALQSRRYGILELIYRYYIVHFESLGLKLETVMERASENRKTYLSICALQDKHALLREQIINSKRSGRAMQAEVKLHEILKGVKLSIKEANDPVFVLEYVSIVRSAMLSGKDFISFERFASKVYRRLKNANVFSPWDEEYELKFLMMVGHALYRNRKFTELKKWLQKLDGKMASETFKTYTIYPKFITLRAAATSYSGDNKQAIELIESALNDQYVHAEIQEVLNMKLNLAVYHFHEGDFKNANQMLLQIGSNYKELEYVMGKEWRFKRDMIEFIVQFEMGNDENARDRMKKMKKYYDEFLNQPIYLRAKIFLNLVGVVLNNSIRVTSIDFRNTVKAAQMGWPDHKEDIQAITFFCWLLSKMLKRPYYELLLERISIGVAFD